MSKKTRRYILLGMIILGVIVLVMAGIYNLTNKDLSDNEKFANEYTEIGKNNVFVYRSADEIIKILESGSGMIYFGFPECPWCQAYVSLLNDAAKEEGLDKIYYCNIKDIRSKNSREYQKIVEILKDYLSKDDEGNKKVFAPDVYVVKDGKIISHNNDTSMVKGDIKPSQYWTSTKKNEIKNIFKSMIFDLENGTCSSC